MTCLLPEDDHGRGPRYPARPGQVTGLHRLPSGPAGHARPRGARRLAAPDPHRACALCAAVPAPARLPAHAPHAPGSATRKRISDFSPRTDLARWLTRVCGHHCHEQSVLRAGCKIDCSQFTDKIMTEHPPRRDSTFAGLRLFTFGACTMLPQKIRAPNDLFDCRYKAIRSLLISLSCSSGDSFLLQERPCRPAVKRLGLFWR